MVLPADADGAGFRAKARAAAFRASGVTAIAAEENADVEFIFLALEPIEKAFHSFEIVFRIAFENQRGAARRVSCRQGTLVRNARVLAPIFSRLEKSAR